MHQQLESAFADAKGPKANLLKWATNTSLDHYNQLLAGGSGSGLQYRMAEKLLLRKIWEKLGLDRYVVCLFVKISQLKVIDCFRCTGGLYSGAAPLSPDTMEFFKKIGLVVCEIYGGF